MQSPMDNRVVSSKRAQFNFESTEELNLFWEELIGIRTQKKSTLGRAALVAFLMMNEQKQREWIRRVVEAEFQGDESFDDFVRAMRDKRASTVPPITKSEYNTRKAAKDSKGRKS